MLQKSIAYFKRRGAGCRLDPYDSRDKVFRTPKRILPKNIDNREECTLIRDQGEEGSCVGHALVTAAEMLYWRKLGSPPDLSERWAYEKAKLHDEWKGHDYDGTSIRGAVKAWDKRGICPEEYWPYKPNEKGRPKPKAAVKAKEYPVAKYERCLGLENIKHAIHYRGCVMVGIILHEGWFTSSWFKKKKIIPYKPAYAPVGGHAVCLVGYDDKKKIFWVKNSWGSSWGAQGYAGVTYKDASVNIRDAWVASIPD